MRVVHIIENLIAGGRERRLIEFLKGSSNRTDIENHLIILSDEILFEEVKDLPHTIISRKEINEARCLINIYKFCKKYKPDIIHAWGELAACHASVVCFLQRIKLVNGMVSSASDKITLKRFTYAKFSFLFSDVILSNSQAGLKSFKVPKDKAKQVYNGFNFKRLENLSPKKEIIEKFGIRSNFVVGMVANFVSTKDYNSFLAAATKILSKGYDISFICVGEGKDTGYTNSKSLDQFKEEFPSENIVFTGAQSNIESIVNVFDIGVLISHGEGISNSILEYMALEKPVIATNKGGTCELVEADRNGFLIGYKDVDELTEKIEVLFNNKELRDQMGKRSKEIIQEKFSIDSMVNKIIDIYKSLLDI